jgi:hypothetical protein
LQNHIKKLLYTSMCRNQWFFFAVTVKKIDIVR